MSRLKNLDYSTDIRTTCDNASVSTSHCLQAASFFRPAMNRSSRFGERTRVTLVECYADGAIRQQPGRGLFDGARA